jgi:curved DNA-binding protein CbpA
MQPDYYALLDVGRDATTEQIREAYRERARHCLVGHDLDAEALGEWLQSLRAAYETLSDATRRAEYDAVRQASPDNGEVPESPDSPAQLKRRIAALEAELARVRRQRDAYYQAMYELAPPMPSTGRLDDLLNQPEGTPLMEVLAEFERSLKE